jgi:L-ascorbate metabolism protein UlaG (beta-lactamase superfamily)
MRWVLVVLAACSQKPTPLSFTYLGVAGWQIEGGGKLILTDPYFTRPNGFTAPLVSDPIAIAAHAPPHADLIVVGHSHADHLLDAPAVALRTHAPVMGSASTIHVANASGVKATIEIKGGEDLEQEGFSVRVIPSLHSAIGAITGEIPENPTLPMPMDSYREGGTFGYLFRLAGRQVLVLDTANFIERELEGIHPDIAILAPGAREAVHDYTCRLMHVLGGPPIVLETHFDAWKEVPRDEASEDADAFAAEIHACSPRTRVIIPNHFEKVEL